MSPNPWERVVGPGQNLPTSHKQEIVKVNREYIIPPKGKAFLPYQVDGIAYALSRKRVLIADEMGLGKTIQAIGVMNSYPTNTLVLIVCPKSLVPNWLAELEEWHWGGCNVLVCHYEALKKFPPQPWELVIIDEAHYIKNPKTKRSKEVTAIAARADRLLLLTGTPILNSPVDLFPLLQLLDPGRWDDFFGYCRKYCDAKYVPFVTSKGFQGRRWDASGASNLEELNEELQASCMIRRMKCDVLKELPEKRWQVVVLENGEKGNHLPGLTVDNYNTVIRKLRSNKVEFQDISAARHTQSLAKVADVIRFVELLVTSKEKLVLFAHHKDVIQRLYDCLKEFGCVRITGDTSAEDRGHAVQCFREDPNCRIFLGSMHAAGVGLNLTVADTVVFAEPDWSPSIMNQCADRVHRINQKNAVNIYILVLDGTLDCRIMKVLVKKQKVIKEVLG